MQTLAKLVLFVGRKHLEGEVAEEIRIPAGTRIMLAKVGDSYELRIEQTGKPRLRRQALAVLARLEAGPATNIELIPISTRFSARIYDLRKAGYVIDTDQLDRAKGITQYTLKGQR